jgi:hypothetical protein
VNARLLERQIALAAFALLTILATLALFERGRGGETTSSLAPPPAAGTWYEAAAGTLGQDFYGRTTTCDVTLTPRTQGVAHPVLPCGARIVVSHDGREVDTRVVDRAVYGSGQGLALTQALADELGVTGVETVRWRFSSGRALDG